MNAFTCGLQNVAPRILAQDSLQRAGIPHLSSDARLRHRTSHGSLSEIAGSAASRAASAAGAGALAAALGSLSRAASTAPRGGVAAGAPARATGAPLVLCPLQPERAVRGASKRRPATGFWYKKARMLPNTRVERLDVPLSVLGEGPVWSEREQRLCFVDIVGHRVIAYRPEDASIEVWPFGELTGSLAECKSGGFLVSLAHRVVRFRPERGPGALETVAVLEGDRPLNRLNDGRADPWGRFWVGSMQADENARRGRLWCVEPSGRFTQHAEDIGVSNSIAFDRARHRMYFADSFTGTIVRSDLDDSHMPGPWMPFAKVDRGAPDGSCIDTEGCLWNAQWGGWRVVRYRPDGAIDRVIEMPTSRPSACTFGGADYKTLFVTTASYRMTAAERSEDPQAGSLYCVRLDDATGVPADLFHV
jgi:sugar lactone lactonase YvrE